MTNHASNNAPPTTAPTRSRVTELRPQNQSASQWPEVTKPSIVRWTTPRIEVVVDVAPGEDISAALLEAVRDEIELYVPVNAEEFDVELA